MTRRSARLRKVWMRRRARGFTVWGECEPCGNGGCGWYPTLALAREDGVCGSCGEKETLTVVGRGDTTMELFRSYMGFGKP